MGDMGDITLNIVLVRDLILEDFEEIKNMGGTMEVNHKKIHKNCILSYTPVSVLQQSSRPTMFGRRCAAKWPSMWSRLTAPRCPSVAVWPAPGKGGYQCQRWKWDKIFDMLGMSNVYIHQKVSSYPSIFCAKKWIPADHPIKMLNGSQNYPVFCSWWHFLLCW